MALVVNDTFTEASDIQILSHTGETGATWARHPDDAVSGSFPPYVDGADEVRGGNTVGNSYHYASGSPANADWKATITYKNRASVGSGQWTGVFLRMTTTSPINGYVLFYINAATPYFRLYKFHGAGPSATQLGSDYTMTLATDQDIDFYTVGTSIQVYNGSTLMISATDSDVTSAGRAGVRFSDYALTGATGGINISRLQAWDSATLPGGAPGPRRSFSAFRGVYTR